jgi:hypothetical protein
VNLYLISQAVNRGYDIYDSAVVAAESEEEARIISPNGYTEWVDGKWHTRMTDGSLEITDWLYTDWVLPSQVQVKFLGKATEDIKHGVICASFNAG